MNSLKFGFRSVRNVFGSFILGYAFLVPFPVNQPITGFDATLIASLQEVTVKPAA